MAPYFIMALFILIVQVGSLWMAQTDYIESLPAPENPENVGYAVYYIVLLLVFSALLIFLIKINKTFVIRSIVYLSISVTLYYVFATFLDKLIGSSDTSLFFALSALAAVLFTVLIYKYPEWYVIDLAGLAIAIGACTVIGVSISYVPIILLMIGLLIYDFISVYKTKHMLTLANGIMDLKLPILFVIPRTWDYSYIDEDFSDDTVDIVDVCDGFSDDASGDFSDDAHDGFSDNFSDGFSDNFSGLKENSTPKLDAECKAESQSETGVHPNGSAKTDSIASVLVADGEKAAAEIQKKKEKSDALFMGLGDAIIPTLLVISANTFMEYDGWISMPSLTAMIGTFAGFAFLMYMVSKGKPQAGLPFLNTGAILGFAAGVLISGAAISFNLGF